MPKPKQFLKESKKKSKHAQQAPETADEYLAAGVDFEEAGEKWRGGDAVKSTRFFIRAIDCYDEALKKFPSSFDLAYNKARVQYELTQHPKLKDQLPGSLLDLLQTALESSRYALALKEDNADVLFNTAQVLTSLAQAFEDTRNNTIDVLPLLEEALELFQRCLTLQEYHHTENLAQEEAVRSSSPSVPNEIPDSEDSTTVSSPSSELPQEERWATIIEPVTNSTLLDTLLAQLETLTFLASQIPPENSKSLSWIEEYSTNLLNSKLPAYLEGTDREAEAGLIGANFIAALADANFRAQFIDISTYARALEEGFSSLNLASDPEGLVNRAEALISYNSSLRFFPEISQNHEVLASRWKALTTALECLTAASKIPTAEEVAKIHMVRGDVELLRYRLGKEGYELALKSAAVLVKNAEKFYRGAAGLARSSGLVKEFKEAGFKEALALGIKGETAKLVEAWKEDKESVRGVLEDAVEDGLVDGEELAGMGLS